jgi:hypothetical protein
MSPFIRLSLFSCAALVSVSSAPAAVNFYVTADESAFASQFPSRLTPTFANDSDVALTTIVTPQVTISQVTPAYVSLLDSTAGFVWTTNSANQNLGKLRLDFAEPVIAASVRYNWTQTGDISGTTGVLSATVRSSTSQVAEFVAGGLPFQQGWLGVADATQPFSSIDLDFSGLTGSMAFYVYGDTQAGAIEYVPAPALAGDYNGDGDVNATDYNAWRSNYGSTALAPAAGADGNADGLVNAADYTVWRDKLSAPPVAIPEPTTLMAVAVITSLVSIWQPWLRASCRRV